MCIDDEYLVEHRQFGAEELKVYRYWLGLFRAIIKRTYTFESLVHVFCALRCLSWYIAVTQFSLINLTNDPNNPGNPYDPISDNP